MAPSFPFQLPYTELNLRDRPDLYRIGKGEQGEPSPYPFMTLVQAHLALPNRRRTIGRAVQVRATTTMYVAISSHQTALTSSLPFTGRFKNPEVATESSAALREKFDEYKQEGDFVGCDMTRKFVSLSVPEASAERRSSLPSLQMQMGYTRARRYANHRGIYSFCSLVTNLTDFRRRTGGKKYETVDGKKALIPRLDVADQEPDKVRAAEIFTEQLALLNADKTYIRLREKHKLEHEGKELDLSGIEVIGGVPAVRGGEAKGEVGKRKRKSAVQK